MQILTATREKETTGIYKGFFRTTLKNEAGEVVATFPANQRQPNRYSKTITINSFKYALSWAQEQ